MESPWGWEHYERTFWKRDDGRKCYIGHFRMDNDPHHWTVTIVRFWAKHPIIALRMICQSGKDPKTFADQVIN